jgi:hypothetical protein
MGNVINDLENFKKELKDLLEKYNYNISLNASSCSDWYGICDARMSVVDRFHGVELMRLSEGTTLSSKDL